MEVWVVRQSDSSLTAAEVLERVRGGSGPTPELVGRTGGGFSCLLDLVLHRARNSGVLGKKLLLPPGDMAVVLRMLLQQVNKEVTGDSDYSVSDLIELELKVARLRAMGSWPECGEGKVAQAAQRYRAHLKSNNLVDRWEVTSLLGPESGRVLVWGLLEGEAALVSQLAGSREVSLCTVREGELVMERVAAGSEGLGQGVAFAREEERLPELARVLGFLGILVNPKDSLSLARACTESSLLSPAQFSEVRKEAERERMPLFPAIVSFVRKVGLGGRSYQPEQENGLFNFLPSLVEFNRIMEKLQTKMEETPSPEGALEAVLACLGAWLEKQGRGLAEEQVGALERCVAEAVRRQAGVEATPGKGRIGRPAVKLATGLLDLLATATYQCEEVAQLGRTPARQAGLVQMLKTPAPEVVLDPGDLVDGMVADTAGLAQRLGAGDCATPIARPYYPRFRAEACFNEGSPALASSVERGVRTVGRTLVASSAPETPDTSDSSIREILREVRARDEQDQEEEAVKKVKKTKRCLAKDVDAAAREKMGLVAKRKAGEGEDKEQNRPKQPAKKKKFATPKGQKKMTSFFTR